MASLRFLLIVYLMYLDNIASTNLDGNELDFVINSINDMKNYISKMKDLELKVSKMDVLESKIAMMEDRDSKVARMDNLEPGVDEMKVLVSKVAKIEELEFKVSKMLDLARVGTLRTCDEYSQYGITTDGLYVVDPDGVLNGEEPFEVFCNFTDGSTQILHDAELLTDIDHCNDPGCFHKTIKYRDGINGPLIPFSQLEALITLSETCTQEFVYQCNLAPLKDHRQNYAYWEDRNGEENYYFHGSHKDVHSCACHYSDEGCEQAVDKGNTCSCDANVPIPLEDTGIISNMSALPIRKIYFGGLRYSSQMAKFRLGRLKCIGKAEFEEGNSCSALKKVGVMRSGLYNIKKNGDTRTSLVHCDMSKDGYNNVPEIDEVGSSSPLGTIAAWVPKLGDDSHQENYPDGWLPCNGTLITKGPWTGRRTPDLNSMGRFLRGGSEKEILTLEDHQVQNHGHIDNGHSHTTSAHTHSNTPHTHSNSPHTHSNTPHTHSNSPHSHNNSPHTHSNSAHTHSSAPHSHSNTAHTHSSSPHTHSNSAHTHSSSPHTHSTSAHTHSNAPHTHSNSPHSHRYTDSTVKTWNGYKRNGGNAYLYALDDMSRTSGSAKINIQSSSVNIASSTVNINSASVKIGSSTVNTHSSSVNIDPSIVNIDSSKVNIGSTTVNTQSSSVNINPSTVNIQKSSININPATVDTQSSSVNIASSTVNVHSSNAGIGGVSSSSNSGDETRPINARVIWIMRVY